jgi:type IV pilus assembly protein PilA
VLAALVLPLAILAAIAIPAYHDYEIRAQVSDGLIAAGKHKEALEAAIRGGSASSAIDSEALELPIEAASKFVEAIEVGSGAVAIVYGKEAAAPLSGKTLALIPALDAERNLAWVCGYAAAPGGFDPVLRAHRQYTDVPKRLLPVQCRD